MNQSSTRDCLVEVHSHERSQDLKRCFQPVRMGDGCTKLTLASVWMGLTTVHMGFNCNPIDETLFVS